MGHYLSMLAGVPLGNVLVNDVQAWNISGSACLTASLWVTGVDGMYSYWRKVDKGSSHNNVDQNSLKCLLLAAMQWK